MPLPYQDAKAGNRAFDEIQKTLDHFGCDRFGSMQDKGRQETIVQFSYQGRDVLMKVSWGGYASLWLKENPWSSRRQLDKDGWNKKAMDVAQGAVCSLLRDWIKAQVTAVACGVRTFEEAFMPDLMLPNGQRLIEVVHNQKMLESKP
ncbi:MAG: hypothetical protein ACRBBM_12675 [Pseudomonadaceae bacterium]